MVSPEVAAALERLSAARLEWAGAVVQGTKRSLDGKQLEHARVAA